MKKNIFDTIKKQIAILTALSMMLLIVSCDSQLEAVIVRVKSYEGSISLVSNGQQCTLMENLLLHSGDVITTGKQSSIDLSLDETKAIGLGEASTAEFIQSGKNIKVDVKEGELYFYTTEKLKDDETFDIRTETLIVGIRGTSGYIITDNEAQSTTFYLTSGKVHVTGKNPNTGGIREDDIKAGQQITTYLFNDKQGEDSVVFNIDGFGLNDLPTKMLKIIVSDEDLLKEVADDLEVSEEDIIDALNERISDDDDDSDSDEETDETDPDSDSSESNTTAPTDDNPSGTTPTTKPTSPTSSDDDEEDPEETSSSDLPEDPIVPDEPSEDDPIDDDPSDDEPDDDEPGDDEPDEIETSDDAYEG